MSAVGPGSEDSTRADEAIAWHVRLQSDDATEADFEAFGGWVAEEENRIAYDRIEAMWSELGERAADIQRAQDNGESNVVALPPRRSLIGRRTLLLGGLVAAAAAAAVVVVPQLQTQPLTWREIATDKSSGQELGLEDGSRLHLNRGTIVRVAMNDRVRRVEINGEASFDVAHYAGRPFEIAAGEQTIRVLGTEFNVQHSDGLTLVTVRRGSVEVALSGRANSTLQLAPGDQSVFEDGAAAISVRQVNPDNAFAWQSGRLVYDNVTLSRIVADLNRYFEVPIYISDPSLGPLRFSGVLALDTEADVVARLAAFFPVAAEQTQTGIELRRRAR